MLRRLLPALCVLVSTPATAELVVPARSGEPRVALWVAVVASMFLAALVGFGALLSSRRTHQD